MKKSYMSVENKLHLHLDQSIWYLHVMELFVQLLHPAYSVNGKDLDRYAISYLISQKTDFALMKTHLPILVLTA